jgi:2-polyprenyl-3-methyl-5-hydroxy-6-metoxy-1,4-benzoquinol methylase/predicted RNA-binding Zn-ribbon protein involved in translation (DUF1610 family)
MIKMNTLLNTNCDFCGSSLDGQITYKPIESRRDAKVYVCPSCGLVQSKQNHFSADSEVRVSSNADWGNVRHGKGARFQSLLTFWEKEVDWNYVKKVLDIGSNRGDFVLWVNEKHPEVEIWAIEPDKNLVDAYCSKKGLNLHTTHAEKVDLPEETFDLAFCSHTLEHVDSASRLIEHCRRAIKPGGFLILEVPNLNAIDGINIVEEFFIDKHMFHFDRETLLDYIKSAGFSVISGDKDDDKTNISLLLRREKSTSIYCPIASEQRAIRNQRWISKYSNLVLKNREYLKRMVDEKLGPLSKRQKVAYWGAGRIFDALIKFGGLEASNVYSLVDGHLHGIVDKVHSVTIERPETLRLREPQVVVILGQSAEDFMAKRAYAFGIRHIIKFSDLMEQIRDSEKSIN